MSSYFELATGLSAEVDGGCAGVAGLGFWPGTLGSGVGFWLGVGFVEGVGDDVGLAGLVSVGRGVSGGVGVGDGLTGQNIQSQHPSSACWVTAGAPAEATPAGTATAHIIAVAITIGSTTDFMLARVVNSLSS
ncbi:hypothetical membrane protein [Renibacterium salmoninarum ATCC 33209]|uniref:Hypothetical membrane protein n=1 Tax=Renibacterium salmoninarum (strain ATCC 33209 / DSM 20767 / JCM 11484 / NBRC 15589 / NCIMB 2235) TaxID=288705 RepID=A9WN61_RENSM|nr:hypothetical protein [Renibacterium salmoninarum]ABY22991.1 hypothetical membrane protein [Renibacterium salmoninarum ATCC 33209]